MPPKRKRNERPSDASGHRPAPHRPSDTTLAQHDRDFPDGSPSHNRRGPGGGGRNTRRNPERRDSNSRIPQSPSFARPSSSSSQAAPLATPTTASTPQPSQLGQMRPPVASNYNYLILTEARLANWQQSGRQEVIDHGVESRTDEDVEEISTISQEFTRAVLEYRLSPIDAGSCIKQILGPTPEDSEGSGFAFDAQTLFLDTISVFLDSEDNAAGSQLREFIAATEISPMLLRQVLEAPALQQLGLIRETFVKMGIRYATNQLYRQANFNLLREESEGYSKLAAELYRTPFHSQGHQDFALVQACWERVKALIGTFDLDVGRVLDVVIDVFSATMLRNIVFFSRFLRISSWWPQNQVEHSRKVFAGGLPKWALPQNENVDINDLKAELSREAHDRDSTFWDRAREIQLDAFFELGGRQIEEADLQGLLDGHSNPSDNVDPKIQWMRGTRTVPPCGNRVAAQLLGFKFRFYASDARDKGETLPANLYYLAAFLIKIGFIALPDLWPHLWPADEQMDALRRRREDELEEQERAARQGNEPNALLMAAALPDDPVPGTTRTREAASAKPDSKDQDGGAKKEEDETALPEPKEAHKADLVSHLLVVGAIPEALFIIGRFPWLPDAYPDEIYPAINRILLHSISKVYQETRPTETHPVTASLLKPEVSQEQSGMTKGSLRLSEGSPVKILKWPHSDGISKGTLYRFYLDDWADNVPVCHSVDDVFTLCDTLLNISGVNIGRDATLVKKLAAIGAKSLHGDRSPHNMARWQDLLRRLLVPSLHLTKSNVDAVTAVWGLLQYYSPQTRFTIYAECYEGQVSRIPSMKKAFKTARVDTLATLKRLALDNVPMSAKKLAKVALSAPGIVCKVALDQIEAYTNLIEAFVECTKYFTDLGYDILIWSLLSSLGGKQRSRTQETSILLTSRWLQALSRFSGKVFCRYALMDPTPVLLYVNDQVARGNSTDLVILRELITSMAGIVSDADFTDAQLVALSGGEVLRRQTLIGLGDKRFETGKSAARLMTALVQAHIAPRLLTNMAQFRQSAIYRVTEEEAHIKYLATLVDDSHQALIQYIELLRSNLSPEDFDARIPNIPSLMKDFGLDPNLAFMIGRGSLTYYMTGRGDKAPRKSSADADGDSVMDVNGGSNAATPAPQESDDKMQVDAPDENRNSPEQSALATTNGQKPDRLLDVLGPVVDTVKTIMPADVWEKISPEFFVLFWSLQTGDLEVPVASYTAESARLLKEHSELKRTREETSRGKEKKQTRLETITRLCSELADEASNCKEKVMKTKLLLSKQNSTWFNPVATSTSIADTFFEECLLPRLLLSPTDAEYCYRMVRFLHLNAVPNFKLVNLYDQVFQANRLRSMIFSCSVREAEFLGRFIKLALKDLSTWHGKKASYDAEAVKPRTFGFATALGDDGKPVSYMDHDQFRDLLYKWHRNLFTALRSCLAGTEWMHIRNAITILKAGLEFFPAVDFMGRQFQTSLAKIADREAASKAGDDGQGHRVDLAVTANTSISALKKHASKWVMVQAFRSNTSGDTADEKQTPDPPKANLRPNAPDFKPQSAGGSVRAKANAEEEDGEIKDQKASSVNTRSAEAGKQGTEPARPPLLPRDSSQNKSAPTPQKPDLGAIPTRSATPKLHTASSPSPSGRQEASRAPTLPGGNIHGLPNRPEVPFPAHFTHDKFGTIKTHAREPREPRDTRDSREVPNNVRETREPRDARDAGPRETSHPREPRDSRDHRSLRSAEEARPSRVREHQAPDRRAVEAPPREPHRPDRPHRTDSSRRNDPILPERESRAPRDRLPTEGSGRGDSSRAQRDSPAAMKPMAPPPNPEVQGPTVNPERAMLIQADPADDRSTMVNPARAAMINDPRPAGRPLREDGRSRNSPRAPSPRRGDRGDPRSGPVSRDERGPRPHRDHHREDPFMANTSGKSGRFADREGDRQMLDRPRDAMPFQGPPPPVSRQEVDHGRLNTQDPEYGRLNPIPSAVADVHQAPDGPRGRGRNSARASVPNPPTRPDTRYPNNEPTRQASPDRQQPPTGPSSARSRRGQTGGSHSLPAATSPAAGGTPSAGIHPERMRQFGNGPGAMASPPQPPYPGQAPTPGSVHPDRMNQISASNANNRSLPSYQTPERPPASVGPPSHRPASSGMPITPAPDHSPMSAPTGPAAANDRSRGGGRRQLSGINNILQGGPNTRTRPPRSSLAGSDAQVLTGTSPVTTPVAERPDPMLSDERGFVERGRREPDSIDRPPRPARRPSRDRSPGLRDSRNKEYREHRERKSSAAVPMHGRDGERDSSRRSSVREVPPSSGRESVSATGRGDLLGGERSAPRETRHRGSEGSSSRHGDYRSGGGRGGVQRREDRRGEPHHGSEEHRSSRKRRSEEHQTQADKRPRR
ncbi:transcription factor/nuclear export subunit protein 2-domain-containing protein [Xylariomycetidae sp. FL0641]|nr:transcription factor/nuclear export subunit protein 2-domain-containing protein [Xylariomycetidae sp. FL0641]